MSSVWSDDDSFVATAVLLPDGSIGIAARERGATAARPRVVVAGAVQARFVGSDLLWVMGERGGVAVHLDSLQEMAWTWPVAPVFDPSRSRFAVRSGRTAQVVSAASLQVERELPLPPSFPDESQPTAISGSGWIVAPPGVLELASGRWLEAGSEDVRISPRGRWAAAVVVDGARSFVDLIDITGRVARARAPFRWHMGPPPTALAWSDDERHMVVSTADELTIVDTARSRTSTVPLPGSLMADDVAVTKGGVVCRWLRSMTMTGCEGQPVYDLRRSAPFTLPGHLCLASQRATVALALDTSRLATIRIGGSGTNTCHAVLSEQGDLVAAVVAAGASPGASAASSRAWTIEIRDASTGALRSRASTTVEPFDLLFHPHRHQLAVVGRQGDQGAAELLDTRTGTSIARSGPLEASPSRWSPAGSMLLTSDGEHAWTTPP